ncbi:conserved hypothetical protein [Afipia carboxidovorans OM5]|uniref:Uncharacterized protein n=1 Tax=Afipia carboxidovorans (strain ATCC 49405 / DSM 1227 / KCTC 32145 / OM5) TaxID=504832 RepID=B6JFE1_AFIC5|nr:hypothetical protein [Afipia carboxidovorans]ACI93689.1 conserved hypothetical protein [Afipia carboxidovorans OM5]AEI02625.1 hypothetical protein OCA4_c14850 [Afipia carboxidovorans OM4]AEI06201.1 hypothetical protein OCA5_c14850 [Afipia carboxidovorans OM5]
MGPSSLDRLREFLAQLPPKSQALLMREFERAIENGGADAAIANIVLAELRKIVRASDDATPRTDDPARLMFEPVEPFLIEGSGAVRPGQVRRSSLMPVWMWLSREGAQDAVRTYEAELKNPQLSAAEVGRVVRQVQLAAAQAIEAAANGTDRRGFNRIGTPAAVEDIPAIGAVLRVRESLEIFGARLPGQIRAFTETHISAVTAAMNIPSLQTPQALPFALSIVMQRLMSPWQIIRLAISVAASDDEVRVAGTPYGMAVTMAIHDLSRLVGELRNDVRRGKFDDTANIMKVLHDGLRGLRTELDIRSDSTWGRQLSSMRAEISNALQSEIGSVPGRVRRLLRQRPDKDITANSRVDEMEVTETAAFIDFVATCRNYAGELAINEVTRRTYSDLQQYIEKATEALVETLRASDARTRPFRYAQAQAAIRFCEVMFGPDYASLMNKAVEVAKSGERKKSRAT